MNHAYVAHIFVQSFLLQVTQDAPYTSQANLNLLTTGRCDGDLNA